MPCSLLIKTAHACTHSCTQNEAHHNTPCLLCEAPVDKWFEHLFVNEKVPGSLLSRWCCHFVAQEMLLTLHLSIPSCNGKLTLMGDAYAGPAWKPSVLIDAAI